MAKMKKGKVTPPKKKKKLPTTTMLDPDTGQFISGIPEAFDPRFPARGEPDARELPMSQLPPPTSPIKAATAAAGGGLMGEAVKIGGRTFFVPKREARALQSMGKLDEPLLSAEEKRIRERASLATPEAFEAILGEPTPEAPLGFEAQTIEAGEGGEFQQGFLKGTQAPLIPTPFGFIDDIFSAAMFPEEELGRLAGKGAALGGAAGIYGLLQAIPAAIKIPTLFKSAQGARAATQAAQTTSTLSKLKEGAAFLFFGSVGLNVLGLELFKDKAPFIQQSFNTLGEEASAIASDPIMTPSSKINQLTFLRQNVEEMEAQLQKISIENTRLRNTKEMLDMQTDLFEKKMEIIRSISEAEAQLLKREFPEADEQLINDWVSQASEEEIKKAQEKYREQLLSILGV